MEHTHGPNGEIVYAEPAAAEPAVAEVDAVKEAADADVEIAKINARTAVKVEELANERDARWADADVAEMRGRLQALEEIVNALKPAPEPEPEPDPTPVVIEAPAEEETAPAPEPVEESAPPPEKKKSSGFWGPAYR